MSNLYFIRGNYPITPTATSVKLLDHCIAKGHIPVGKSGVYTTKLTQDNKGVLAVEPCNERWSGWRYEQGKIVAYPLSIRKLGSVYDTCRFQFICFDPDTTQSLRVKKKDNGYINVLSRVLNDHGHSNGRLDLEVDGIDGLTHYIDLQAKKVFTFKASEFAECINFAEAPAKIHIEGDIFRLVGLEARFNFNQRFMSDQTRDVYSQNTSRVPVTLQQQAIAQKNNILSKLDLYVSCHTKDTVVDVLLHKLEHLRVEEGTMLLRFPLVAHYSDSPKPLWADYPLTMHKQTPRPSNLEIAQLISPFVSGGIKEIVVLSGDSGNRIAYVNATGHLNCMTVTLRNAFYEPSDNLITGVNRVMVIHSVKQFVEHVFAEHSEAQETTPFFNELDRYVQRQTQDTFTRTASVMHPEGEPKADDMSQFSSQVNDLVGIPSREPHPTAYWTPQVGMFVTLEGRKGVYVIESLYSETNEFIVRTTYGMPCIFPVAVNAVKPYRLPL